MVLPESFVLPSVVYFLPLVILTVAAAVVLWTLEPPVTDETVVAFVPWILLGATFHVLYQIDAIPSVIAPLFSAPSVYLTTATLAGFTWIVGYVAFTAGIQSTIERLVLLTGVVALTIFLAMTLLLGWQGDGIDPFWSVVSIVLAGILTVFAWVALSLTYTEVAAITRATGVIVVFSHALDGVSTAVGFDRLGAAELVPASRMILEFSATLPTAEYIGAGWLFAVIKLLLALLIIGLFTEYVRERPRRGRIVLALVAAVGLGPAMNNLLLFTVG